MSDEEDRTRMFAFVKALDDEKPIECYSDIEWVDILLRKQAEAFEAGAAAQLERERDASWCTETRAQLSAAQAEIERLRAALADSGEKP